MYFDLSAVKFEIDQAMFQTTSGHNTFLSTYNIHFTRVYTFKNSAKNTFCIVQITVSETLGTIVSFSWTLCDWTSCVTWQIVS